MYQNIHPHMTDQHIYPTHFMYRNISTTKSKLVSLDMARQSTAHHPSGLAVTKLERPALVESKGVTVWELAPSISELGGWG